MMKWILICLSVATVISGASAWCVAGWLVSVIGFEATILAISLAGCGSGAFAVFAAIVIDDRDEYGS